MDDTVRKELELLILTREEDYRELSNKKIKQVNNQLNMRMDVVIESFEELNKKMVVLTNKVNNMMK